MIIGIITVFLCRFQKSKHVFVTKCLQKGKSKRTEASLFHAVFVVHHANSQHIPSLSCYFSPYLSSVMLIYAQQICVITKA
jgi:hypothetical protein